MTTRSTTLTNDELLEWATAELRKYDARDRAARTSAPDRLDKPATNDASRIRAIIAGQQAVSRDVPNVSLTGDFSAVPALDGGWMVRYGVRNASDFGRAPSSVIECFIAANGSVNVLKSPRVKRA